jgi:hypothetical protein
MKIFLRAALASILAVSILAGPYLPVDTEADPVDTTLTVSDEATDSGRGDRVLQDDPSYQVTVQSTSRCTANRLTIRSRFYVTVKDSEGLVAIKNTKVSLLLVAQDGSTRSYSSEGTTNRRGAVSIPIKNISVEDAGQELWCSIAIPNADLPFDQQVPCTFTAATCN